MLPYGCVKQLVSLLGARACLDRPEDLALYEYDGGVDKHLPDVVVFPRTTAEVAGIVKIAREFKVPLVGRGAGTGLSGGAIAREGGIVVAFARMNAILEIDLENERASVQPGVVNLDITGAVENSGYFYAPDPSSQRACTIGGNVAENSGGVHCLKYGMTLHNVLRVRGFTAEGEPVEFGSEALDTPGIDLLSVVIGSEGMLAITTEVTVKLVPKPELARCMVASFPTIESAGSAVANVIARGIVPAGLELMDQRMTAVAEDYVHAGYDLSAAALLLCESDGTAEEVAEEIAAMERVLWESGASRIEVSQDEAQRLKFWSGRKNAFPASGGISPDYMCMDSTIPRKCLAEMLLAIQAMESKYQLQCVNVFHAGDGNLHPLILFDANDRDQLRRCELFGAEILEASLELGGTVTGEHGVGVEKLNSMCVQFSPEEREQFIAVKRAFDPAEMLNPGKVIPTLSRCAEYGKMHVHRGMMPFPELPRF
jgi:glycolate oxidase